MKIKDSGIILSTDNKLRVEVLLDDGITTTIVEIDPGHNIDKSEIDIKKEIKDIINTIQLKKDNLANIKIKLEGKTI